MAGSAEQVVLDKPQNTPAHCGVFDEATLAFSSHIF